MKLMQEAWHFHDNDNTILGFVPAQMDGWPNRSHNLA